MNECSYSIAFVPPIDANTIRPVDVNYFTYEVKCGQEKYMWFIRPTDGILILFPYDLHKKGGSFRRPHTQIKKKQVNLRLQKK